jgi:PTS system mannose-specific IIC component
MGISLTKSLLLALWAAFCILDLKSFKLSLFSRPLLCGFGAGIIMNNIPLGLTVGGTLELTSMGFWNFGGATIPDYTCATIIGVAIGSSLNYDYEAAVAVAIPVALLFTYFDILAMTFNTMYVHKADKYCDEGNTDKLEKMHNWGFLTWAISRGLPVFLACYFGSGIVDQIFAVCPAWVFNGMGAAGKLFPALGVALLLRMLPAKKYFVYVLTGFILAAYLKLGFIPVALAGIVVIGIVEITKKELAAKQSEKEAQ